MYGLLKFFSIFFIVVGMLLLLVGYYFRIMQWPDLFSGIITGPAALILGIILFVIKVIFYGKRH